MSELISGFGPSGPGNYLECPLEQCGWMLRQDRPDEVDYRSGAAAEPLHTDFQHDAMSATVGPALVNRVRREEAAVRAHLDEHDVLDFVQAIHALRRQIAEHECVVAEVGTAAS